MFFSNRLLHAAPEQKEEEELSVLQQELISDLAELYQTSQGADDKRGKKRERLIFINKYPRVFVKTVKSKLNFYWVILGITN